MEQNESFEFTYSAPEQEEIRKIREKYMPPEERKSKMDKLRELDAGVTRKGSMVAIILGTLSALVMGTGMSMCMVWAMMVPGVAVGIIGMVGVAAAYPVYQKITEKERQRIAPEILKLTDELMQ